MTISAGTCAATHQMQDRYSQEKAPEEDESGTDECTTSMDSSSSEVRHVNIAELGSHSFINVGPFLSYF